MTQITRFAARDAGPVARVAGFMAHLRDNGFRLGVAETDLALRALSVTATDIDVVRRIAADRNLVDAHACRFASVQCRSCDDSEMPTKNASPPVRHFGV